MPDVLRPLLKQTVRLAEHLNVVSAADDLATVVAKADSRMLAECLEKPSLLQLATAAGAKEKLCSEALEVFAHGTTKTEANSFVRMQGRNLSEHGGNFGGRFFTALDVDVANEFALRTVSKVGGEPSIVGLAIPRALAQSMERNKWLVTRRIDDRLGLQCVFESQAIKTLQSKGFFFEIPKTQIPAWPGIR
ncbi:MAG: hypothetical protein K2X77_12255 [Candidatus Obscuribacterales bacterium]|nr:hypothetical protein [Candidatus Obscuribacterales bacterium]